ncbi:hypothetical protein EKL30_18325 [Candidimonas sp. SYP-B2681]|uniref:aminotransferase class IV n=1 Tax=Candidimonas sp. SYP-B2681 TaxID=2497686 RepID=UPI000F8655B9|nr:aminotransferase class IV [Candidimonas sp. SYP-B2681]RTZ39169.1 hypothetical protein EKL30_18325 [Candidimonas sp. SYP-B2681]
MPESTVQLIETIRVDRGRSAPLLAGHWRRLQHSCIALDYVWPGDALMRAVEQHIGQLDADTAYRLRLLLSKDGAYSIACDPLPATPHVVRLHISNDPLQADRLWLQHKTTYRPWYDHVPSWLEQHPEYFDVVFCNHDDEVCEGSRSNIYVLDVDMGWLTPPLTSGLLPGVQRQALLDTAMVKEARITRQDLLGARAIRISNALRGWLDATL